jgi:hypothetical protein
MNIQFATKPTNKLFHDLDGNIYIYLTVLGYAGRKGANHYWWCRCKCGTVRKFNWQSLMRGCSTSCGCRNIEVLVARNISHGESRGGRSTIEYAAYRNAKARCTWKNSPDYKNYGERGIKFLFTSFQQFLDELGRKPEPCLTLERKNNHGNYEPGNVEWATRLKQRHNQRPHKIRTLSKSQG